MSNEVVNLLGVGIYTVPEASRLSLVHTRTIHRWIRGYEYRVGEDRHWSPQVITPVVPTIDGKYALSFKDLIEVRFVDAFRKQGVSWKVVRQAAESAKKIFRTSHPFSTKRFQTDGRTILAELATAEGDGALLDIVRSQFVFREVLAPYLRGLELSQGDEVIRWWPLERRG